MPLRDYTCRPCGVVEEDVLAKRDAPSPTCTKCGAQMSRLPSAPAFHLQGKGWARDGYTKK